MKRGFTLVELLVVIAIISVLGTAVVLVLNPAELLRQGRDSTRVSDLSILNKSIAFYLSQSDAPGLGGADGTACSSLTVKCTTATTTSPFSANGNGCGSGTPTSSQATNGTGWVTVDFQSLQTGSPLSRLPLDPHFGSSASSSYFYAYACNGLYYELNASLESIKYASSEVTDGGNRSYLYEIGSKLDL